MVILKFKKIVNLPIGFTGKLYDNSNVYFVKNKQWHRYYGPTQISFSFYSRVKYWCFNNDLYNNSNTGYNQQKFIKDIDKKWLS